MDAHADDWILWRLECMTDKHLRWLMTQFLIWCEEWNAVARGAFMRVYDWETDGL